MKQVAMLAALAFVIGIVRVASAEPCGGTICATDEQPTTPGQTTPSPCDDPNCTRQTPSLEKGLRDLSNATEHALKPQQIPATPPALENALKDLSSATERALKPQ